MYYGSLLSARQYWTAPFALTMVREDDVNDALYLVSIDTVLLEDVLQFVCTDIDVSQQIHILLCVAAFGIFVDLAIVVKHYGEYAPFNLDLIG